MKYAFSQAPSQHDSIEHDIAYTTALVALNDDKTLNS